MKTKTIMKTNHLFKIVPLIAFLLFAYNCKNEVKQEADSSTQTTTEENSENRQGQAFVEDDVSNPNVLQIALGSPDHTTLVAAVQAAQLENALVNAGPLMVFAPTNAAFDALPAGTVEDLLKPENKETLATILKHHVTAGNYDMDLLKKVKKLGQADDTSVMVETKGDDIYVGGAKILGAVKASNGTVYVVDKVILPQ
jgi:uncharacterized surface protein with fasciclin (FAS1) repeats